jgi:hypothetical protein
MGATLEIEPERGKLIDSSELASQITSVATVALAVASSPANLKARRFGRRQRPTSRVVAPLQGKADARDW